MKEVFKKYQNDKLKLSNWQKVSVICLIVVFSGIIGWIYEFVFYFFNSGMKHFYMRGANFLPWINIYAWGALLIIITTRKLKKRPFLMFLVSGIVTCILEYFSGYFMYKYMNGIRCWDYNKEILNFGSINGFVCLRSFICFGLSALLLMRFLLPFCIYLVTKIKKKYILTISIILCSIFLFDELYNLIFARLLLLPRARNIYESIGIRYMNYFY